MRTAYLPLIFILLLLALTWGCGRSGSVIPDKITIYSIDGTFREDKPKGNGEDYFGHPVLGLVTVEDAQTKQEIVKLLNEAIAVAQDRPQLKCFEPRHGLSMTTNGRKIDYVICFHCGNVRVIPGSQYTALFGEQPKALLSKLLADAGVPVAP